MQLSEITWERIWFYLSAAAVVVFALWKSLPPFLTWLENVRKNRRELLRLDRSEAAELKKVELQHEIDLKKLTDEQLWKLLEAKDKQIAHLEDVIDQKEIEIEERDAEIEEFTAAEKARAKLYLKKINLLNTHRNRLQDINIDVLNEASKEMISNKLMLAINDVDEYEKLLN